ncbi:MAG: hypothetical protein FJ276_11055 [Planctomycetes bacterium]|nr:hypothetical protein [Planctomycetota bacterium]
MCDTPTTAGNRLRYRIACRAALLALLLVTTVAADGVPDGSADWRSGAEDLSAFAPLPATAELPNNSVEQLPMVPVTALDLNVRGVASRRPPDVAADYFANAGEAGHVLGTTRQWAPSHFAWQAPALCHRPLYFQDVNLERHGLSYGWGQPAVSTAHAFGRFAMLPYMMAVQPPWEHVYALGYERPGCCVPVHWHTMPLRARGVAAQAMAVTGLIFIVP